MKRIAVLIENYFEDSEYTEPAKALRDAGCLLVHLGFEKGATVKGKSGGVQVRIDESLGEASVEAYDALFIPGGYSPDRLRGDERAVALTRLFMASGRPIFAICHGPQLLISAGVLSGRRVTGWKSIAVDIKNAGASFVDAAVVEDGNLISSRSPADLPQFIAACLKKLNLA
jgi:protease I